ncbi:DUF2798 domain-containing protein [Enterococcus rivorum]|uniref:DUF2798 domain-containing protein n=1 Tax=Enterococcus rivorum TaxID=762845 RepID=UPI000A003E21|nr:DUF2798 domain-containing protein [Enterococcus rivorum]MBP2099506.1 hypothetical protein [Enterococcus rivorum]
MMAFGMTIYNTASVEGFSKELIQSVIFLFLPGFIVAFIVDAVIGAPVVKNCF